MARTADEWLNLYSQTHRNPVNKQIHRICVPVILWTVLALAWSLPSVYGVNSSVYLVSFILLFYLRLGFRYFAPMLIVIAVDLALSALLEAAFDRVVLAEVAGVVFVIAWLGQFYGHKVEGRKPAFFDDIFFLLIGPLWIVESLRGPKTTQ